MGDKPLPVIGHRRCTIPAPAGRMPDVLAIRQSWEPPLNPDEFSVQWQCPRGVAFMASTCRLNEIRIYGAPKDRHEFALAVADFFMYFRTEVYPHLVSFSGFSNCKLREMKGDAPWVTNGL